MNWKNPASVLFSVIIISNFWLSSLLEDLSPLPSYSILHYLAAIVCGILLYMQIKELVKTFYAVGIGCLLASLLVSLVLYIPASLQIITEKESMFFIALRQGIFMFLINFPLCFGGAMVASVLFPD